MKTLILATLLLASSAFAQSVNFTWTNNNSSIPACGSGVSKSCIVGQTMTDITGTANVLSSTISPTASTYSIAAPAPGTYKYSLVVNGKDASGNAVNSSAATATVVVSVPFTLSAPTGFTVTVQ